MRDDRERVHSPVEPDMLDTVPDGERATTRLERSFGPSCLLSLVIVLLLLLVLKRFLQISWTALLCLTIVIWLGVMTLLLRWRPDRIVDEE